MAGHSKFKKIKHKKEQMDAKRSKDFSRVSREILIAAKLGGDDPKNNPRLRMAMLAARHVNFPRTKIEDAIRKGVNPNEGENVEEITCEGFGPSGVAFIVEAVSTSKQMQIDKAAIKKEFTRHGGSLGEGGCVTYLFQRLGLITYPGDVRPEDDMLMLTMEHGAEDCQRVEDEYKVFCAFENLHRVKDDLEACIGEPSSAKLIWKPNSTVILDHAKTKRVLALIDDLDSLDVVQNVYSNLELPADFNDDV